MVQLKHFNVFTLDFKMLFELSMPLLVLMSHFSGRGLLGTRQEAQRIRTSLSPLVSSAWLSNEVTRIWLLSTLAI